MAERRMLLNSAESFVGTMRIDFTGRCEINLNNKFIDDEKDIDAIDLGCFLCDLCC